MEDLIGRGLNNIPNCLCRGCSEFDERIITVCNRKLKVVTGMDCCKCNEVTW